MAHELQKYSTTGVALRARFGALNELVDWCSREVFVPFVVVDGSSGVGKTQSAFALRGTVIYINLVEANQLIYQAFSTFSMSFQKCIDEDLTALGHSPSRAVSLDALDCSSLKRSFHLFYTAGLLVSVFDAILEICQSDTTNSYFQDGFPLIEFAKMFSRKCISFTPSSVQALQMKAHELKTRFTHSPIIVLDEVPSTRKNSTQEFIAFSRNICRVTGLVTIVMGTECTVANLLSNSSRQGDAHSIPVWARLFSTFPPSITDIVAPPTSIAHFIQKTHPSLSTFVQTQFAQCRPLIAQYLFDQVKDLKDSELTDLGRTGTGSLVFVKRAAIKVFHILQVAKRFSAETLVLGELCLFLPSYAEETVRRYLPDDATSNSNGPSPEQLTLLFEKLSITPISCSFIPTIDWRLVMSHFALIVDNAEGKIYVGGGVGDRPALVTATGQLLQVRSYFPKCEVFLWLVIIFGIHEHPRTYPLSDSVFDALFLLHQKDMVKTSPQLTNPSAVKVDGSALEGLSTIALCFAASTDLAGTPMFKFITNFISWLGVGSNINLSELEQPCFRLFHNKIHPFLVPPGMLETFVSSGLSELGALLASVERPLDKEMIDARIFFHCNNTSSNSERTDILRSSIEAKDRKSVGSDLLTKTIKTAFERHNSNIHFLVCRDIQTKYPIFDPPPQVASFVVAKCEDGTTKLCPLTPINVRSVYERLFFVVPVNGCYFDPIQCFLVEQKYAQNYEFSDERKVIATKEVMIKFIVEHRAFIDELLMTPTPTTSNLPKKLPGKKMLEKLPIQSLYEIMKLCHNNQHKFPGSVTKTP